MFKPLGQSTYSPIGSSGQAVNEAAERVTDLPGSNFFAAWEAGADLNGPPGVYYKDRSGTVRRLVAQPPTSFRYLPAVEPEGFARVGTLLFVPDVDPRAWAANPDQIGRNLREIVALPSGCFFSALQVGESRDSNRRGLYLTGDDERIRRLLRNSRGGIELSEPVPQDRFEEYGEEVSLRRA